MLRDYILGPWDNIEDWSEDTWTGNVSRYER